MKAKNKIENNIKQETNLPPGIEAMITDKLLNTFKEEYLKIFENRTLKYGLDWRTQDFWEAFKEACRINNAPELIAYHRATASLTSQIERLMIERGIISAYEVNLETSMPVEIEKHLTNEFLLTFRDELYKDIAKRFGKDFLAKKIKNGGITFYGYHFAFEKACRKHNKLEVLEYYMHEIDDVNAFGAVLEEIMKDRKIID